MRGKETETDRQTVKKMTTERDTDPRKKESAFEKESVEGSPL